MTCPICGQLPGDPMTRPFGCFGRGERECTLRASEALGKHGRPLAWAADELRRELADAKAEVERLNRVLEDEAIEASAALRSEMATLLSAGSCESPEDAAQRVMRELADARSELSELRAALAAAAMASSPERGEALEGYSLRCVQRYPDGGYRAVFDHPSEEPVGLPLFGCADRDGLQANLQKQLSDALGQAAEARKECAKLRAEAQRLRSEASIDSSSAIIARVEHRSAVAEADELRRLAWAYCIEATRWRTQEAIRGRYEDRLATLLSRICGLVGCELGHEVEGVADVVDRLRSAEVMFAKYVDHLPTAVLADSPAQPIESVGALALLRRLDGGGSVVPTSALTPAEIAVARSGYRMWVDSRGYGYVYLPGAHRRVDATAAQTPIESLGPDVHEVALRIFVEMQVTSAYERAVAAAYEKARAFVDHREAVLRGEKSEWESDR